MISPKAHCEFEWILPANSLRLSMDTRRYPSGISPFCVIQHQFFSKKPKQQASTDKRDFSSSVSRQFHGHFLLFLDSLEFWFLFLTILFSVRTVFVRFFLLLASRCARDLRGVHTKHTKSEITPCYADRPYKFGNTEQGWSWKGLQEQTNHRTSYQCKKPLQNAFVWNGCHGNGKQLCIHNERLNFFFILWIISDVESVNILKLNSFSV